MNFIKRGFISVTRKPGKTMILLLIVFILGNIICGAISIQQAVTNTDNNLRAQMSPVATLEIDYKELEKRVQNEGESVYENVKALSLDTIKKVGELPTVKNYDYTATTYLMSRDIKPYTEDSDEVYGGSSFKCLGGQDPEIIDMQQNIIKLISGRTFHEDEIKNLTYVAVISQNLADKNNLTIGSAFKLDNVLFGENYTGDYENYSENEENVSLQSYEFEVIGIFEPVKKASQTSESGMVFDVDNEMQNTIYTTNKVMENANQFSASEYAKMYDDEITEETYYDPIYVLNDPKELETFKEQAAQLLPELYTVKDTNASYETVAAPMKSIQQIAKIVLYVAVGASLIILSLLVTLFLRDRKHEIGIYLSLGEQKIKVVTQIVLEVVLVAFIAITLSLFSGNILAGTVSDKMLNDQIIAQQEEQNNDGSYSITTMEMRGYGSDISTSDITENYHVSLDFTTILLFFAIGIGTVVVSTVIPIIYITRLNPKKIMM